MVEVVRIDDFDHWLRRLKDRVGRLRIVERLDRLAAGNPSDAKLWGGDKATQQRDIERAYPLAEDHWSEEGRDHD